MSHGRNFAASLFFIFSSLLFSSQVSARQWQRITIPDAVCGSGLPYSVFLSTEGKDQSKFAIEFMGGGACWSLATCYGTKISAWMFPLPKIPRFSILTSEDPAKSPVSEHSMLFFPYCTGDAYGGSHTESLGGIGPVSLKANFHGARNIALTFDYLTREGLIDPSMVEELFVGGSSAGGIGSLFHINTISALFSSASKKTMLVDSPGLHWNERFWQKFSPQMLSDFNETFNGAGLSFDPTDGMVAGQIEGYCNAHPDWTIGFLQASRDSAMTKWFGDISADEFEQNILSSEGLIAQTQDTPNCSSWVHRSTHHMYYVAPYIFNSRTQGVSAVDYAFQIYRGMSDRNYVDHLLIEAYPNF